MENGAQVGGQRQSQSKKDNRRKTPWEDVGQKNLRESENEFMKLQTAPMLSTVPSHRTSQPVGFGVIPLHTYLAPRLL